MDLRSRMPDMFFRLNTTVFKPLFATSNMTKFHVNLNVSIIVFCTLLSHILTINISSTNGTSIFINFHSFGFNIICSFAKRGIDLFKKLKHDSHVIIMPS